jgi:hypothetical protein
MTAGVAASIVAGQLDGYFWSGCGLGTLDAL